MFDMFEVSLNGNTIKGFPAFCILVLPILAIFLLGVICGAAL